MTAEEGWMRQGYRQHRLFQRFFSTSFAGDVTGGFPWGLRGYVITSSESRTVFVFSRAIVQWIDTATRLHHRPVVRI